MQKKLIARTAKLSSESKKSRHFKGIAITYEHIPKDLEERNHGSIYAVINIDSDTDSAEEIAEVIIDAFHGEFYQDLSKDPLTSFEGALTKINEELADVTHQGKIGWLNHLNAVLAVLSDNTFHLTQAGKAEAFLYRGEKSSHISEDLGGDSINPLRTFVNIASGSLAEADKIAIVTPGVFFHISKDELKKYVQEFQPRVAISHIADLIEGTTTEMKPNAVLILEAITPEAASNETLTEQPDEVWIAGNNKPLEDAYETAKPIIKKTGSILTTIFATTSGFIKERALPAATDLAEKGKDSFQAFRQKQAKAKRFKENVLVDTEESISHKAPVIETDELDAEPVVETKAETVEKAPVATAKKPVSRQGGTNEIFIREEQKARVKWLKLEKVNFSVAQNLGAKISKQTKRAAKNRGMLLVAAVLALVIVVGGGYFMWQGKTSANNLKVAKASLAEAQNKYDSAQAEIAEGQRKSAVDSLNEANKITEDLKKNKLVANDATALSDKIKTATDQALNIQRNAAQFADATSIVGNDPIGPFAIGTNLFLINKDDGTVAAISMKNGEVANVLDKPNISGKVTAATAIPTRRVIAVMTDSAIYEFDTVALTMKRQTVLGEIETATSMASFGSNIYSLEANTGKVYKRAKTTGGYGARTEYITDGTTVSDAVSIAIDSNLYVLESNGNVNKYLSGKKQTFEIADLPFNFDKPSTVYTTEDVNGMYVVDSGKNVVAAIDSNGNYVEGFTADGLTNLGGIFIDDASHSGYVNAGGKIFKLSL